MKDIIGKLLIVLSAVLLGVISGFLVFQGEYYVILLLIFGLSVYFFSNYIEWTFLILLLLLPLQLEISSVPISLLFGMCFIGAVLLKNAGIQSTITRIQNPVNIFLFIFFLIVLLSVLQSRFIPDNPYIISNSLLNYPWVKSIISVGVLAVCMGIMYSVMVYLLSFGIRFMEKYFNALKLYAYSAVFYSAIGIIVYIIYIGAGVNTAFFGNDMIVDLSNDSPRLSGVEQEPLFFGFYLLTILPVLCSLWLVKENVHWKRRGIGVSIIIIVIALFLTQSRSAILGFIFSILTIAVLERRRIFLMIMEIKNIFPFRKFIYVSAAILFMCFTIFTVYDPLNAKAENFKEMAKHVILDPITGAFDSSSGKFWSTRTRFIAYEYAITFFREHPFLGVGYGNYNFHTGQRFYYGLYDFNMNWPETNNYPLKIAAELGILGIMSFSVLLIVFFTYLKRAASSTTDPIKKGLIHGYIAMFAGIGILLLFSSVITKTYLWVAIGMSLVIAKVVNEMQKVSYENCN